MVEKDSTQKDPILGRVLDEEKDKYIRGKSPDWPRPEDEDSDERTREDEDSQENAPEEQAELFHKTYNNFTASEDTENEYLIILLYNNIKHVENIEEETRKELFFNLYNNLGRQWFRTFIDYLLEHRAIMWENFSQVNPGFKQQNFYRSLRIIKPFIKKVKISNPNLITQGNQPKIYMWKWASSEDFHNEQGRYAKLLRDEKEAEREFIRLEQRKAVDRIEVENASKQRKREENLRRVLEIIGPPISQLSPLYETLDSLDINDPDERSEIREYFVNESRVLGGIK